MVRCYTSIWDGFKIVNGSHSHDLYWIHALLSRNQPCRDYTLWEALIGQYLVGGGTKTFYGKGTKGPTRLTTGSTTYRPMVRNSDCEKWCKIVRNGEKRWETVKNDEKRWETHKQQQCIKSISTSVASAVHQKQFIISCSAAAAAAVNQQQQCTVSKTNKDPQALR